MKVSLRKCLWVQVACLSLWPILLFAQSPDLAQNLADCKNGWETCDRSKLSPSESDAVALARHGRNVSNCRNGYNPCDRLKLTQQETLRWHWPITSRTFMTAKTARPPATLHY
jgi:hypothetical protein